MLSSASWICAAPAASLFSIVGNISAIADAGIAAIFSGSGRGCGQQLDSLLEVRALKLLIANAVGGSQPPAASLGVRAGQG